MASVPAVAARVRARVDQDARAARSRRVSRLEPLPVVVVVEQRGDGAGERWGLVDPESFGLAEVTGVRYLLLISRAEITKL